MDDGEVSVLGENENVVRIVSIHKSKGLEYPVVFVAGNSKAFNRKDLYASLLIDQEYGLASDYVDFRSRVRVPTIKKAAVKRKLLRENVGEEMRVLYVALTRAKQKLILSGTVKDEETYEKLKNMQAPLRDVRFPENYLLNSRNPMVFFIPAVERMIARADAKKPCPVAVTFVKPSDLTIEEIKEESRFGETIRLLGSTNGRKVYDSAAREIIEERFSYVYPYEGRGAVPAKVSVSELKHGQFTDEEAEEQFPEPEIVPYIPEFMRKISHEDEKSMPNVDSEMSASSEDFSVSVDSTAVMRGTAYHRVMELLDYESIRAVRKNAGMAGGAGTSGVSGNSAKESISAALMSELEAQVKSFVRSGRILQEEAALVNLRDILTFVLSGLGERMEAAFAEKKLYREQPFTLGVRASEINSDYPEDEPILVQGIIDAFFYEGDSIVLVDYKTDRVRNLDELRKRYQIQLDSYEEALSRVTGYPVSRKIIWSFAKGRELVL